MDALKADCKSNIADGFQMAVWALVKKKRALVQGIASLQGTAIGDKSYLRATFDFNPADWNDPKIAMVATAEQQEEVDRMDWQRARD
jgi:hypothetical protein